MVTNDDVLAKLEEDARLRGYSPKIMRGYLIRTQVFMRFFEGRAIEDLNEHDIRNF
ncbi:MAG: Phage integrase, N-terminal SAM-like domain [Lachnospiraceae bacterium]|jgi:hypothetical protein|nr:Phage integrase, N-terminal SAM-like domain [Lachnospiraceae bacterium]